ncbi:MAG: neutral zinc metallopeptidase [Spirochaetes bacterium]|nr:neutral zinc metallopeptidase [Spirochaetota bacterium]
MREDGRESDNVEDRRDENDSSGGGGGGFSLPFGNFRGGSILTIILAIAGAYFLGISPTTILSLLSSGGGTSQVQHQGPAKHIPANDKQAKFVAVVLADTEDVWRDLLPKYGKKYSDPKLVLFRRSTPTACGRGKTAMGPFYCPGDHKVYIDLSFYDELKTRYHAPGDFAQAYVIGHEIGHHVQTLLGTMSRVNRQQQGLSEAAANALSVKLELQADCYAGVWGFHANKARHILESGDVEAALNAAAAIGDDTLQKSAGEEVVPESFTHGSSAERVRWFKRGVESGDLKACDTFASN